MSKELMTKAVIDMTLRLYINQNFNEYDRAQHIGLTKPDEITEKVLFRFILDYFNLMTRHYCPFWYEEIDFKILEPIEYIEEEENDY